MGIDLLFYFLHNEDYEESYRFLYNAVYSIGNQSKFQLEHTISSFRALQETGIKQAARKLLKKSSPFRSLARNIKHVTTFSNRC
jgi:hypothetical protein